MSKVVYYDGEDFENEILDKEGITLIDFFAEWCGPCKMLSPILDELSEKVDYKIVKIDTDKFSSFPTKYKIRSLPTMMIFKNGEPLGSIIGFTEEKEIIKKVNEYVNLNNDNIGNNNSHSSKNETNKKSFLGKIFGKK